MPTPLPSNHLLTSLLFLCLTTLTGCQLLTPQPQHQAPQAPTISVEQRSRAEAEAQRIFAEYSAWRIEQSPVLASRLAKRGQFDWDDISSEAQELQLERLQQFRSRLKALDEAALSVAEAASYHTLLNQIENQLLSAPLYLVQEPFANHNNWLLITESVLLNHHPVNSIEDAHDYIARINALPQLIKRWNEHLLARQKAGYLSPQFAYQQNIAKLNSWLQQAPFTNSSNKKNTGPFSLWQDFQQKIKRLALYPSSEKLLLKKMQRALKKSAKPAYQSLLQLLEQQQPLADNLPGLAQQPQGLRYYQLQLQRMAATGMDANQVFQFALAEVGNIQQQIRALALQQGWKSEVASQEQTEKTQPFAELTTWLQQQPRYFNQKEKTELNRAAVLGYQRQYIQKLSERLPYHFTRIPQKPLALTHSEHIIGAYRSADSVFSYLPGINQQPAQLRWNPAKALHYNASQLQAASAAYAIPGLHLQLALAQQNTSLPAFRRQPYFADFNNGWKLYSQELAQQILAADSATEKLALLQQKLELLITVVVDCGIHAKQWNRLQAVEYISTNSTIAVDQAQALVNRVLLQPGEAAVQYLGYHNLVELQQKLTLRQTRLLPQYAFDEAAFHSEVLWLGAVPQDVLENSMQDWLNKLIQQKKRELQAAKNKAE